YPSGMPQVSDPLQARSALPPTIAFSAQAVSGEIAVQPAQSGTALQVSPGKRSSRDSRHGRVGHNQLSDRVGSWTQKRYSMSAPFSKLRLLLGLGVVLATPPAAPAQFFPTPCVNCARNSAPPGFGPGAVQLRALPQGRPAAAMQNNFPAVGPGAGF